MKQLKTHLPVNLYTRQHYLTAKFAQTQCPIKEKTAVFLGFSLENGCFLTMAQRKGFEPLLPLWG